MAFWGGAFVFDGIPCEEFELMIYDIGNHTQSSRKFASTATIVEEKIASRYKPYFYGVTFDNKLKFTLVFGLNEQRVSANDFLTGQEMDTVASWLTGHSEYKWLEIIQPDMEFIRYRCMITDLEVIEYGWIPWAFKATVECDGPFGYERQTEHEYIISGNNQIHFENRSSYNGYYYPTLEIRINSGDKVVIENVTDNGRTLEFTGLPTSASDIKIDCGTGIITGSSGLNLYPYCNLKFLRLKKGENILNISYDGTIKFICEFPINMGG